MGFFYSYNSNIFQYFERRINVQYFSMIFYMQSHKTLETKQKTKNIFLVKKTLTSLKMNQYIRKMWTEIFKARTDKMSLPTVYLPICISANISVFLPVCSCLSIKLNNPFHLITKRFKPTSLEYRSGYEDFVTRRVRYSCTVIGR